MQLIIGNIWDHVGSCDGLFVTTCGVLKSNAQLVMGAGIAKQAAERYPDLPFYLGSQIVSSLNQPAKYGIITGYNQTGKSADICAFQTKMHWRDPSDLDLIEYSVAKLKSVADNYARVLLNCPGIGKGQLKYQQVRPILTTLPSNVTVFVFDEKELK